MNFIRKNLLLSFQLLRPFRQTRYDFPRPVVLQHGEDQPGKEKAGEQVLPHDPHLALSQVRRADGDEVHDLLGYLQVKHLLVPLSVMREQPGVEHVFRASFFASVAFLRIATVSGFL